MLKTANAWIPARALRSLEKSRVAPASVKRPAVPVLDTPSNRPVGQSSPRAVYDADGDNPFFNRHRTFNRRSLRPPKGPTIPAYTIGEVRLIPRRAGDAQSPQRVRLLRVRASLPQVIFVKTVAIVAHPSVRPVPRAETFHPWFSVATQAGLPVTGPLVGSPRPVDGDASGTVRRLLRRKTKVRASLKVAAQPQATPFFARPP